jgi:cell division protein ZapA
VYPLTVELNQEEGLKRKKKLMLWWSNLKKTMLFATNVLAMCALQFASQSEQKQIDNAINGETIERIKKSMPS